MFFQQVLVNFHNFKVPSAHNFTQTNEGLKSFVMLAELLIMELVVQHVHEQKVPPVYPSD